MKLKDIILASLLVGVIIVQNLLLFSLPLTLTYVIFYILVKNVNSKTLVVLSVISFVIVKNIIFPAIPLTIIFDITGLLVVLSTFYIKNNLIKYILVVIAIVIHILLLDLSYALISGNIIKMFILSISTGFITYIYAPLSIILIVAVDGIDVLVESGE